MIIPYDQLAPETLNNILATFITRYDERPIDDNDDISKKIERLINSLRQKKIFLSFDEDSESFNLLTEEEVRKLEAAID